MRFICSHIIIRETHATHGLNAKTPSPLPLHVIVFFYACAVRSRRRVSSCISRANTGRWMRERAREAERLGVRSVPLHFVDSSSQSYYYLCAAVPDTHTGSADRLLKMCVCAWALHRIRARTVSLSCRNI